MKKILILVLEVLVLCIGVSTFAFAEDLGLEAGAEMGFGDVADETVISISGRTHINLSRKAADDSLVGTEEKLG